MPDYTHIGPYKLLSGWMWYTGNLDMVDEGWKLHISGDATNGQAILDEVLPMLQVGNFPHKFLKSTEDTANQTGLQAGKFLAVYPSNIVAAFIIVSEVDRLLTNHVGQQDSPVILHEKRVGQTVVYTRYGAYNSSLYHPSLSRYENDSIGKLKPDWIEDPWGLYSSSPNIAALAAFEKWPKHDKTGRRRKGR